jgi:Icc-related predicted phosphoesterase
MKIVVISDTHTKHKKLTIPECDVLVHCGDFTWDGKFWDVWRFVHWLEKQPARHKVVIAGNHEETLDHNHSKYHPRTRGLLSKSTDDSIHYLEDSGIEIDGIKFYGTPWTPWFYDWGFNGITDENLAFYRGVSLSERYSQIPEDVQVLICHGPPYDILDRTLSLDRDNRKGSVEMRKLTSKKLTRLGLYLCGHIHEARGMEIADGGVTFINASTLDRGYEIVRPPVVIHLDENGWVQNVEDF